MKTESILLGLIGEDIALSRTPAMHEAEGLAHGANTVYRRLDTSTPGLEGRSLEEIVQSARITGFNGLNITHPYKQKVLQLLDEVSEQAAQLGSVNTVVISPSGKLTGYNTDVTAFERALEDGLVDAPTKNVVQVGAGGVGNAVAYSLVTHGVERLQIADIDRDRAQALASMINSAVGREVVLAVDADNIESAVAAADGVVNATPMGMPARPGTAFDTSCLTRQHWVADVVYMPIETELLAAAHALGCRTLDGTRMAINQAVDSFRLFTGLEPDAARMRKSFLAEGENRLLEPVS